MDKISSMFYVTTLFLYYWKKGVLEIAQKLVQDNYISIEICHFTYYIIIINSGFYFVVDIYSVFIHLYLLFLFYIFLSVTRIFEKINSLQFIILLGI